MNRVDRFSSSSASRSRRHRRLTSQSSWRLFDHLRRPFGRRRRSAPPWSRRTIALLHHLVVFPEHRPAYRSLMVTVRIANGENVLLRSPPVLLRRPTVDEVPQGDGAHYIQTGRSTISGLPPRTRRWSARTRQPHGDARGSLAPATSGSRPDDTRSAAPSDSFPARERRAPERLRRDRGFRLGRFWSST